MVGRSAECYTSPMLRAIYFDYHGVLDRRNFAGLLSAVAETIGQPVEVLRISLEPLISGYVAGAIAPVEFWNTVESKYGPTAVQAGKKYILHVDPAREMWELLNALHERYAIGLFSDCPADKKEVIVHGYNLPDFFDQLIFSCDARQTKIDPNFFRRMLRDGQYRPDECLLIDDSHQAVGQAAALGFVVHQFTDVPSLKSFLQTVAPL